LSHDSADRSAKNIIRVLCAVVERLRNDADEGNRRTDCVTYRRIAASRVPSEEAFGRQPQSGDAMLSLHKRNRGGCDLHEVGNTLDIEQVGATELMCKRLAIVAVADHAIDRPRRCIRESPANFPATAPKISLGDHVWPSPQKVMILIACRKWRNASSRDRLRAALFSNERSGGQALPLRPRTLATRPV